MSRSLVRVFGWMYTILLLTSIVLTIIGFAINKPFLMVAFLYFVFVFEREYIGPIATLALISGLVAAKSPITILILLIYCWEVVISRGRRLIKWR